jgi:hypothetical protein
MEKRSKSFDYGLAIGTRIGGKNRTEIKIKTGLSESTQYCIEK